MSEIQLATNIVHWPGNDIPSCDAHTAALQNLGLVLGCPVSVTPITTETVCYNCVNKPKTS